MGHQPASRPMSAHRVTQTQNEYADIYEVEIELRTPVLALQKRVHEKQGILLQDIRRIHKHKKYILFACEYHI
jgi:hypothetical protein